MLSGICWKSSVGLVIWGEAARVQQMLNRYQWLPIRGIEILRSRLYEVTSLDFLVNWPNISYLRIIATGVSSYAPITTLRSLKELRIEGVERTKGLDLDLAPLSSLCRLDIEGFIGEDFTFSAPSLRALGLMGYTGADLSWLNRFPHIEELTLMNGRLNNVSHLELAESLTWLCITSQRKLHDFSGLSHCNNVKFLWIELCPYFADIALLQKLTKLETVRIIDCDKLLNIQVLADMPAICHIHLHTKGAQQDFKLFQACAHIESLYISTQSKAEEQYWQTKNRSYKLIRPDLRANC